MARGAQLTTLLLLLVVALGQGSGFTELHGRVVDNDRKPIAGVTVLSTPSDEATSDANGEFTLLKASELVRFSAPGYRPMTRTSQELVRSREVTLTRDPQALWVPPACLPGSGTRVIKGTSMQFALPRGATNRKGSDVDYEMNVVCRGKSCLQHGSGPTWSPGFPLPGVLAEFSTILERDVQVREPGLAYEYRGIRSDGTLMRFVGMFGETVSYDHAPKEAADFFDKIIDSLCWQ